MENNLHWKSMLWALRKPHATSLSLISPPHCSQSILGWKHFCTHSKGISRCWLYYQKHLSSGEQDYLFIYNFTQQVPVRVTKYSAMVLLTGKLWIMYTVYSEKYESTHVAFIWYNSPVIKTQNGPWMTHRDFLKR